MSLLASRSALAGNVRRVRPHVGDKANRALVARGDALVELLGNLHRPAGGEPQLARCLLLKRARDEWRSGPAASLPFENRLHHVVRAIQVRGYLPRPLPVGYFQLTLPSLYGAQRGLEVDRPPAVLVSLGEIGVDSPVFLGNEGIKLLLPVHYQPQRDRLHAARGQPAPHLAPQHGAEAVAHQPVQDAPRLLGVDETPVQLSAGGRTPPLSRLALSRGRPHAWS